MSIRLHTDVQKLLRIKEDDHMAIEMNVNAVVNNYATSTQTTPKAKTEEVAEKVSKSRTTITNSLRLLKLDDRVLDMLIEEKLSGGHARALLGIADSDAQYEAAVKVQEGKLSVRDTEKLVKNINNPVKKTSSKKELQNDFVYKDLEEQLKQRIGTKVKINRKTETQGKLEIDYYSQEELEKIIAYFK